jgi:hypothetical protein
MKNEFEIMWKKADMSPDLNLWHCSKSQHYCEAADENDESSVSGPRHEPGVVCLCIPLLLLDNNSIKTFSRKRRIVRGDDFYAIRVVTKEHTRLSRPINYFLF